MPGVTSTRDILIQTEQSGDARTFYSEVLGFRIIQDSPEMCGFETGAFRLFIETAPRLGPVLELEVDDLGGMKAQLLAAGCTVIAENSSIPQCHMRDPFGLAFNLRQRG